MRTGSPRQTCRCANCLIGAGTTQQFAYIYGAPNSESSSTKRTAIIGSSGGVSRLLTPIFRLNNIKKNFYSATDFDEARNRNVKALYNLAVRRPHYRCWILYVREAKSAGCEGSWPNFETILIHRRCVALCRVLILYHSSLICKIHRAILPHVAAVWIQ